MEVTTSSSVGARSSDIAGRGSITGSPMSDAPRLSRRSGPLDFFAGAAIPVRAAALLFRSRRLTALSLLCALVTLVIFAAWAAVLWRWLPGLLRALWTHPEGITRCLWNLTLVVLS